MTDVPDLFAGYPDLAPPPKKGARSRHVETVVERPGRRLRPERPARADPLQERCACGAYASFGRGPPAVPTQSWFCAAHRPADFYAIRDKHQGRGR